MNGIIFLSPLGSIPETDSSETVTKEIVRWNRQFDVQFVAAAAAAKKLASA